MRLLTFALALFASGYAAAHDLKIFASVENGVIHVRAYHPGGGALANADVSVRGPGNEVLATLTTDDEGRAEFTPPGRARYMFIVETPDGHRAEFSLDPDEIPEDMGHRLVEIEDAVSRQLRPLREQLDQLENTIRLRDILGGIGYVVGVLGLLALIKSRNRAPS